MTKTVIDLADREAELRAAGEGTDLVTNNPTAANTHIAHILQTLDKGFARYSNALAEWGDFAGGVENNDGTSQLVRRLAYPLQNKCQQAHIALYGNRSMEEVEKNEGVERRTVRFCASLNLAYWERRWFGDNTLADQGGHMQVAEYVDPQTGELVRDAATGGNATYAPGFVNEPDGQWGPSPEKASCMIRYYEAKQNYVLAKAEYDLWTETYTAVTDKAYEYVPYQERAAQPIKNQSAFAAAASKAAEAMKKDMEAGVGRSGSVLIKKSA